MAEQIAARGKDVVFFTLEQSKLEMVSKGIARRTAMADKSKGVTSLAIRKGAKSPYIREAAELYKAELGDRFSVVEGSFKVSASFIGDYVRQYMANNNVKPVVFVDYLQILQPTDPRQSTKETLDRAVSELRQLSMEVKTPIVVVSSVNRANYLTPIDFESLKESGGIEYTADAVYGLQLQCLNQDLFQQEKKITEKRAAIREAKAANPRKIELTCLKSRGTKVGESCFFDYYPAFDLYEKCTEYDFPHIEGFAGRPATASKSKEINSMLGVKPR
jgi:replicative DNA helicase